MSPTAGPAILAPMLLPAEPRRILVIRGGAIGDFILTLPVLAALRQRFEGAWIEVLGYPHIAQLAVAGGLADRAQPIETRGLTPLFAPEAPLSRELAAYFGSFAIILSYLYDPGRVFESNVVRHTQGRFIAGPHRPDSTGPRHATEVLLGPLEQLGLAAPDPTPRLPMGGPVPSVGWWLALHPGSGSESKNWPEPKWASLLPALAQRWAGSLLLVGGEAEGDRLQRLSRLWPADRLEVARSVPLVKLAFRLAACRFFVGHDSGITHLAAALGLPGLVLWGPSSLAVWRPRSDRMECLSGGASLAELDVEPVLTRLDRRLRGTPSEEQLQRSV